MPDTLFRIEPHSIASDIADLLGGARFGLEGYSTSGMPSLNRPMFGTTLYLAQCDLETRYGVFHATIFQDITDKHHILALACGDVHAPGPLYTRLHSSCVTSETLGGCDCDCSQQLEGAFKVIASKGRGILFYLIQEGRGVGYVGKSRDRMLVQAAHDRLSTFQAYHALGLQKDYRHYNNISDICRLLGIEPEFIVLTNNPDKLSALRDQGIKIAGTEPLEFEPGPFNLAYLSSKAESGHSLKQPGLSELHRAVPPEQVVPFHPRALAGALRFIHASSYFLPIRPIDNTVVLSSAQFAQIPPAHLLFRPAQALGDGRVSIQVDWETLTAYRRHHPDDPVAGLLSTPYWFRVHAYYDVVTSQDFVVLTYGKPGGDRTPLIRLHSDSLFNRFPLKTASGRKNFQESIKRIVTHGHGILLLLNNSGHGASFGAFVTRQMLLQQGQITSEDEADKQIGTGHDTSNCEASTLLLRQHLPGDHIEMIMDSPECLVWQAKCIECLQNKGLKIDRWHFLNPSP